MASGDYHHTALAVARGVGMIAPQGPVIIIQTEAETRPATFGNKASARKAADKSLQASRPAGQISRAVSFAADLVKSKEREHQGLIFHMDNGSAAQDDALDAIAAIAQVSCCKTCSLGILAMLAIHPENVRAEHVLW